MSKLTESLINGGLKHIQKHIAKDVLNESVGEVWGKRRDDYLEARENRVEAHHKSLMEDTLASVNNKNSWMVGGNSKVESGKSWIEQSKDYKKEKSYQMIKNTNSF